MKYTADSNVYRGCEGGERTKPVDQVKFLCVG
jgi:hypothetical protein